MSTVVTKKQSRTPYIRVHADYIFYMLRITYLHSKDASNYPAKVDKSSKVLIPLDLFQDRATYLPPFHKSTDLDVNS